MDKMENRKTSSSYTLSSWIALKEKAKIRAKARINGMELSGVPSLEARPKAGTVHPVPSQHDSH